MGRLGYATCHRKIRLNPKVGYVKTAKECLGDNFKDL